MTSVSPSNTRSTRRKKISSVSRNSTSSGSMQPYHAIDDGRWAEARLGHDRGALQLCVAQLPRSRRSGRIRHRFAWSRHSNPDPGSLRSSHARHARREKSRRPDSGGKNHAYRKRSMPTPWARHSPSFRKRRKSYYTRQTRGHDHPE